MTNTATQRTFAVQTTINRPASVVFDAIVNPAVMTKYFVDATSGALRVGDRVIWNWAEWGDYPVVVDEVVPYERVVLRLNALDWKKTEADSYDVRVTFEIVELAPEKTMLRISESGWKSDDDGIKASYENCAGWQHMATCLKAFVEHGIDLR